MPNGLTTPGLAYYAREAGMYIESSTISAPHAANQSSNLLRQLVGTLPCLASSYGCHNIANKSNWLHLHTTLTQTNSEKNA